MTQKAIEKVTDMTVNEKTKGTTQKLTAKMIAIEEMTGMIKKVIVGMI